MDIYICQSCGHIVPSPTQLCESCGAPLEGNLIRVDAAIIERVTKKFSGDPKKAAELLKMIFDKELKANSNDDVSYSSAPAVSRFRTNVWGGNDPQTTSFAGSLSGILEETANISFPPRNPEIELEAQQAQAEAAQAQADAQLQTQDGAFSNAEPAENALDNQSYSEATPEETVEDFASRLLRKLDDQPEAESANGAFSNEATNHSTSQSHTDDWDDYNASVAPEKMRRHEYSYDDPQYQSGAFQFQGGAQQDQSGPHQASELYQSGSFREALRRGDSNELRQSGQWLGMEKAQEIEQARAIEREHELERAREIEREQELERAQKIDRVRDMTQAVDRAFRPTQENGSSENIQQDPEFKRSRETERAEAVDRAFRIESEQESEIEQVHQVETAPQTNDTAETAIAEPAIAEPVIAETAPAETAPAETAPAEPASAETAPAEQVDNFPKLESFPKLEKSRAPEIEAPKLEAAASINKPELAKQENKKPQGQQIFLNVLISIVLFGLLVAVMVMNVPKGQVPVASQTKATQDQKGEASIPVPGLSKQTPGQVNPIQDQTNPVPVLSNPIPVQSIPVPVQSIPVPVQPNPIPVQYPIPVHLNPVPVQSNRSPIPGNQAPPIPNPAANSGAGVPNQNPAASVPNFVPASQRSVSGKWEYGYQNPSGSTGFGVINITQKDTNVRGSGKDSNGDFQIKGVRHNDVLGFDKLYVKNGVAVSKRINFSGKLSVIQETGTATTLFMTGIWRCSGTDANGKETTLSGPFEGRMIQALNPVQGAPQRVPQQQVPQQQLPQQQLQQQQLHQQQLHQQQLQQLQIQHLQQQGSPQQQ